MGRTEVHKASTYRVGGTISRPECSTQKQVTGRSLEPRTAVNPSSMASSQPKTPAGAAARRFQDLPAELIERILRPLEYRDRARCGVVCRRWLAVSRCSPALWGRVQCFNRGSTQRQLAELSWLGGRGPVREAKLYLQEDSDAYAQKMIVAAAFTVGCWADTLEALHLSCSWATFHLASVLPSLRHLSLLRLFGNLASVEQVSTLSSMHRLRVLSWEVWCEAMPPTEAVLPLPPQLEHLRVLSGGWVLPQRLPAQLQSLKVNEIHPPASLDGLSSLTLLEVACCDLEEVPSSLSTLTALRHLDLMGNPGLGAPPNSQDAIAQALRCMPHREYLQLEGCGLAALPDLPHGSMPPLKVLDICSNSCCIQDSTCLRTLEYIACGWRQVPSKELCATATKLRHVAIWHDDREDVVPGQVVAQALNSLGALPALIKLGFYPERINWDGEVAAALWALAQARLKLRALVSPWDWAASVFPWPDADAPFQFPELQC